MNKRAPNKGTKETGLPALITCYSGAQRGASAKKMDQSPLGNVLGHRAQMAVRQSQIHHAQNEVLTELAKSLAADRAMLRELHT